MYEIMSDKVCEEIQLCALHAGLNGAVTLFSLHSFRILDIEWEKADIYVVVQLNCNCNQETIE